MGLLLPRVPTAWSKSGAQSGLYFRCCILVLPDKYLYACVAGFEKLVEERVVHCSGMKQVAHFDVDRTCRDRTDNEEEGLVGSCPNTESRRDEGECGAPPLLFGQLRVDGEQGLVRRVETSVNVDITGLPEDHVAGIVPWDDASNVIFREAGYVHIDAGFNPTHKALLPVYPQLTEEERWRSTFALIPPTLCVGTAPDQAFFFIVRPITAGTIDIEVGYLFHPTAVDHPLFDQLLEASDAGVQVFIRQDQDATTKVQAGLSSRFAPRGRYSWQEESHVQFNRWLFGRYSRWWPKS